MKRFAILASTAVLFAGLSSARAQDIIFQTFPDPDPNAPLDVLSVNNDTAFAVDAIFADAGRTISKIDVSFVANSFFGVISSDVTLNLYDVAPGGLPGSVLFTSAPQSVSFTALSTLISFTGINTVVPQEIRWGISFTNLVKPGGGGDIFGPVLAVSSLLEPAGASTNPATYYFRDSGAPSFTERSVFGGGDSTFVVMIEADVIPEPSGALLTMFGAAMLFARHRITRHRK